MATTTHDWRHERRNGPSDRRVSARAPATERTRYEERREIAVPRFATTDGIKVSWGGVWGGVLAAAGILLLLAALGIAIGITATDPGQADASRLGTAAGIWGGVSLLVALFVGGLVATRIGATFDRSTSFWEGALVWVMTLMVMAYLTTTGLSSLAGGAFSVLGGSPQAAELGAGSQAAAGGGAGLVGEMKARIDQAASRGELQQKAAEVKPAASKAAWITFGALLVSLLASLFGAMAGRRRRVPVID